MDPFEKERYRINQIFSTDQKNPEYNNLLDELRLILLSKKKHINYKNRKGNTFLSRAIIENRADIVLLLLDLNASCNTVNNSDYMPIFLFLQSKLNDLDIFSRILKKTKNINAQVNFGQTLLHYICNTSFRQHAYAYLELLLNAGPDNMLSIIEL